MTYKIWFGQSFDCLCDILHLEVNRHCLIGLVHPPGTPLWIIVAVYANNNVEERQVIWSVFEFLRQFILVIMMVKEKKNAFIVK